VENGYDESCAEYGCSTANGIGGGWVLAASEGKACNRLLPTKVAGFKLSLTMMASLPAIAHEVEGSFESNQSPDAVRTAISRFRRALERAKVLADDEDETRMWARELEKYEKKLRAYVQLQATQSHVHRREALLSNHNLAASKDSAARNQAANESLIRTRALVLQELNRLAEANKVLKTDGVILGGVGGEYAKFGTTLKVSQKLVMNMQRRDQTDQLLMYLGLVFFLCVVAYIVQRRLMPFFSPIAWLVEQLAYFVAWVLKAVSSSSSEEEGVPMPADSNKTQQEL
jgi:hypothetical protein